MKDKILQLINNNLASAKRNADLAHLQFDRMTQEQLNNEYGQSGRKCKDLLAECDAAVQEATDMKAWFMRNTPNQGG